MKKIILFTVVFLMSHVLFAQHASFGLKAGANFSNLWIKDNSTKYRTGLHVGALSHIHLSHKWAIQPELLYSQQGGKRTISNVENNIHVNYINIPVLFQRMFDDGFRLEAGPQIGFLVNAKIKSGSNETDVKSSFKSVDFSFPIGIGYLTKSGLGFDGRWVPGFSDIQKTGVSTANNVFQFGIFYQFPGK
jgi:hypothetical protein